MAGCISRLVSHGNGIHGIHLRRYLSHPLYLFMLFTDPEQKMEFFWPKNLWLHHPCKCWRPGWTGTTWSSGKCHTVAEGWNEMIFTVLSNRNHSGILWKGGFKVWVFWWNTCLREESSCLHCREAAMGWRWRQYRKKEELARQKKSQGDKFGWILDHTGLGELWNGLGEVKTWALGVWKGEQWVSLHH